MNFEIRRFVDAAHKLPDTDDLVSKKCTQLHGHTYCIIVKVQDKIRESGMVVDFGSIKEVVDILDHTYINDVFAEHNFNEPSTTENVAIFIYQQIQKLYNFQRLEISVSGGYKGDNLSTWVSYAGP